MQKYQALRPIQANRPSAAKTQPKSAGVQRKRSRSEINLDETAAEELEQQPSQRVLFPKRAAGVRAPKLDINIQSLPLSSDCPVVPEVDRAGYAEMLRMQVEYLPNPQYLLHQRYLNPRMRAVLLDWMFEVAQEYGLKRETLHTSINFVDRYLSREENTDVPRNEVQLVGVTALWLASKIEEILPPPVSDFAAATDGGCSAPQILEMEGKMVQALDWKLVPCTPLAFAMYYLQILTVDARKKYFKNLQQQVAPPEQKQWMMTALMPAPQLNRVMELLDLALLDIDSLCFTPAVLAATTIYSLLSLAKADSVKGESLKVDDFLEVAELGYEDIKDCVQWFRFTLQLPRASQDFVHRHHVVEHTLQQELHFVQRHHPSAITIYKDYALRSTRRHPAAERALQKRLNPSFDDSDEDPELRTLNVPVNKTVRNVAEMMTDDTRYSPTTQVAMRLENTSIATHVSHSPQRRIQFEGA